ncbi:DUF6190 family protein [Streptomyces sp. LMG1-1-1.1]|uniref:DUF6190 family protein n=1 Tax=Streptomyces sp. LMG1-1-1.1 TaxID=3135245 RepID=UPI00346616ED
MTAPGLDGLPTHERLVLAQVFGKGGVLRTASPRLLRTPGLPVEPIVREGTRRPVEEPSFPDHLKELYQRSLVLTTVAGRTPLNGPPHPPRTTSGTPPEGHPSHAWHLLRDHPPADHPARRVRHRRRAERRTPP